MHPCEPEYQNATRFCTSPEWPPILVQNGTRMGAHSGNVFWSSLTRMDQNGQPSSTILVRMRDFSGPFWNCITCVHKDECSLFFVSCPLRAAACKSQIPADTSTATSRNLPHLTRSLHIATRPLEREKEAGRGSPWTGEMAHRSKYLDPGPEKGVGKVSSCTLGPLPVNFDGSDVCHTRDVCRFCENEKLSQKMLNPQIIYPPNNLTTWGA